MHDQNSLCFKPQKKEKTMNTTILKRTITVALLFAGHIAMAENPAGATAQENAANTQDSIQELAELGPGVHRVKKTANNVFKSCVVVGQARISTVLGKSKGLATARRNAKLKAESEFVSWLKTNTASVRSSGDETEFTLKGEGTSTAESGKSTETSVETITSCAQGAIRGLSLIGSHCDTETSTLTLVYAWKPDFAKLADQVESAMEPNQKKQSRANRKNGKRAHNETAPSMKAKTVVAPGAEEFL